MGTPCVLALGTDNRWTGVDIGHDGIPQRIVSTVCDAVIAAQGDLDDVARRFIREVPGGGWRALGREPREATAVQAGDDLVDLGVSWLYLLDPDTRTLHVRQVRADGLAAWDELPSVTFDADGTPMPWPPFYAPTLRPGLTIADRFADGESLTDAVNHAAGASVDTLDRIVADLLRRVVAAPLVAREPAPPTRFVVVPASEARVVGRGLGDPVFAVTDPPLVHHARTIPVEADHGSWRPLGLGGVPAWEDASAALGMELKWFSVLLLEALTACLGHRYAGRGWVAERKGSLWRVVDGDLAEVLLDDAGRDPATMAVYDLVRWWVGRDPI